MTNISVIINKKWFNVLKLDTMTEEMYVVIIMLLSLILVVYILVAERDRNKLKKEVYRLDNANDIRKQAIQGFLKDKEKLKSRIKELESTTATRNPETGKFISRKQ